MGFMAAKKCCNGCEIAQACSHAYTTKPPCAVENFTDAQQLKQAIALLNRWMDDPDQDMLLSDTDRFVRDSATACV